MNILYYAIITCTELGGKEFPSHSLPLLSPHNTNKIIFPHDNSSDIIKLSSDNSYVPLR